MPSTWHQEIDCSPVYNLGKDSRLVAHAAAQMSRGDISFTRNQLSISVSQPASFFFLASIYLVIGNVRAGQFLHKWQPPDELAQRLVAWRQSKGPKEETKKAINIGLTTLHWHQFIWQQGQGGMLDYSGQPVHSRITMWSCSIGCSQDDRMYRVWLKTGVFILYNEIDNSMKQLSDLPNKIAYTLNEEM